MKQNLRILNNHFPGNAAIVSNIIDIIFDFDRSAIFHNIYFNHFSDYIIKSRLNVLKLDDIKLVKNTLLTTTAKSNMMRQGGKNKQKNKRNLKKKNIINNFH